MAQPAVGQRQKVEPLFGRHAAHPEEHLLAAAEHAPHLVAAPARSEPGAVDGLVQVLESGPDAVLSEVVLHGPRGAEHDLGLVVEAAHVRPQGLAHDVVGGKKIAQARQIGVVRGDQRQAEGAGQQDGDHAHRSGRGGVDDVDVVVFAPVQELEHRRHEQRELFVNVEAEPVEGLERLVRRPADPLVAARDHGERPALCLGEGDERLQHCRHAVDLVDRVGEHRHVGLGRRGPGLEQPLLGQVAVNVAGVDALAGERGRRQQVGSDQRLGLAESLPGLERLLGEPRFAQLLEAVAHRTLPRGLGDRGQPFVAHAAAHQGAAADDLGGAAGGRLAQRPSPFAPPGRVDGEADETAGELSAALPFEHRPGNAGTHTAAHQRA